MQAGRVCCLAVSFSPGSQATMVSRHRMGGEEGMNESTSPSGMMPISRPPLTSCWGSGSQGCWTRGGPAPWGWVTPSCLWAWAWSVSTPQIHQAASQVLQAEVIMVAWVRSGQQWGRRWDKEGDCDTI